MSECMGNPYAAQIRAAKAEGELAATKDALREFAEENGFNPELEPRDLLAKAAGAFRSCAAMSDARYTEIQELKAELEAMRPRLMPEGMEWLVEAWPRFEDGEPVRFGDVGLDVRGKRRKCYGVKFTNAGLTFVLDDMDRAWWANDCGPLENPEIDPGKRVKRPQVIAADGEPLEAGQTVWDVDDGCELVVTKVTSDAVFVAFEDVEADKYDASQLTHERPAIGADGELVKSGDTVWCVATDEQLGYMGISPESFAVYRDELTVYCVYIYDGELWASLMETIRDVKVNSLTHQRPVMDADGKPLRDGDTVWHVDTGHEYVVIEPSYGDTVVVRLAKYDDAEGEQYAPDQLTHERPDSWERLEEDAGKNPFDYCKDVGHRLDTCESSEAYKARDLVRRCKALAGVTEDGD